MFSIKQYQFLLANFGVLGQVQGLGSGHFSCVYATNRMTVLKFTVDNKYNDFVQLCKKIENPLFPKILNDFGVVAEVGGTKLYAYELPMYVDWSEALISKQSVDEVYEHLGRAKSGIKNILDDGNKFKEKVIYSKSWDRICSVETFSNRRGMEVVSAICLKFGIEFNTLMDALYSIKNEFKNDDRMFLDMHGGNWMCDPKTGGLIMSDPVASYDTVNDGFEPMYLKGCMKIQDVESFYDKEKAEEISKLLLQPEDCAMKFFNFKKSVNPSCTVKEFCQDSIAHNEDGGKEVSVVKSVKVLNKSTGRVVRGRRRIEVNVDMYGLGLGDFARKFHFDLGGGVCYG